MLDEAINLPVHGDEPHLNPYMPLTPNDAVRENTLNNRSLFLLSERS